MAFRLWRRVRAGPFVANLTKRGLSSISIGTRGAHLTVSRRARRFTLGLPGSGLFWTHYQRQGPAGPADGGDHRSDWLSRIVAGFLIVLIVAVVLAWAGSTAPGH
jgi:Protein of unknown function (DUF4236)